MLVTWPLAGRSAEQWAPVVVSYLVRSFGGPDRRRGPLSGLEIEEIPAGAGGAPTGIVVDRSGGTWTAAMRIGGSGFALGDDLDRSRKIAAWSAVLAASAREGGALHRLQWAAGCLPASFEDDSSLNDAIDRGIASHSYRSLLERARPLLWRPK